MKIDINVCTNESCKVMIEDLTIDYQPEYNTNANFGNFRYSDTISIDVLQHIKTDGRELQNATITPHGLKTCPVTLPVNFDGWFKVHHIVLPTEEWFNARIEEGELSILKLYQTVYYSDGEKIYKYIGDRRVLASLEEIVERSTENTTLSRVSKDYVSICFLRKCYINLCQQILNSKTFDKCFNKMNNELTLKRDMVWMAINVINYMVDFNQLYEVSRLIERITSCNGLCPSNNKNSSGCGCGS